MLFHEPKSTGFGYAWNCVKFTHFFFSWGWGNGNTACQGIVQLFGFAAGEIIGYWLGEPRPTWALCFSWGLSCCQRLWFHGTSKRHEVLLVSFCQLDGGLRRWPPRLLQYGEVEGKFIGLCPSVSRCHCCKKHPSACLLKSFAILLTTRE